MLTRHYISAILIFCVHFVFAQTSVVGHYVSNFPEIGWFGTHIQLNADSTFKYQFTGDMFNDRTQGTYTVDHDTIKLSYSTQPLFDTIKLSADCTILVHVYSFSPERPTKFYYKNEKLWRVDSSGKLIKKALGPSNRRRFLLFGRRIMRNRKHYLEKVDAPWQNW